MIQLLAASFQRRIAYTLLLVFYCQFLFAGYGYARAYYPGNRVFGAAPVAHNTTGSFHKENKEEHMPATGVSVNNAKEVHKAARNFGGGPSQPEMQAFQSVNANNMVDLFSGDFSYNIPLMDVGGYPINIAYRSGISMDQEASWVGLGWNVNPGTITRNMRGLPDDFNGSVDSIRKTGSVKENKTVGITVGAGMELVGVDLGDLTHAAPPTSSNDTNHFKASLDLGVTLGVFQNNYKGVGLEIGANASINAGSKAYGGLTGGLSMTNNSQNGLTLSPSLSLNMNQNEARNNGGTAAGSLTLGLPYNTRTGLKGLEVSAGLRQYETDSKNQATRNSASSDFSSVIAFSSPSFTPTITLPYTSTQFSFTGKVGFAEIANHPNLSFSGYVSSQTIADEDKVSVLPSYGYLNYQEAGTNSSALLDFNREKEIPYRDKPAIPHIAVPNYTYDLFSITGEGTGGMFRAYRSDVGFVFDHFMRTKDNSDRLSIDVGVGNVFHGGTDLNLNRAYTQSGPWLDDNAIRNSIAFRKSQGTFEAAYFRNPGEKSINSKAFYDAIGGDDVVDINLYQAGSSSSGIIATNALNRYTNKQITSQLPLLSAPVKSQRDKRSQVISYLTAQEASTASVTQYIESYGLNAFSIQNCHEPFSDNVYGDGDGLIGQYYNGSNFNTYNSTRLDNTVNFCTCESSTGGWFIPTGINPNAFSVRWTGRLKAPVTGAYIIGMSDDDGVRIWVNDTLVVNNWVGQPAAGDTNRHSVAYLNLVENILYTIKIEYFQNSADAVARLKWIYPGQTAFQIIPQQYFYSTPPVDKFTVNGTTYEKRVNSFRKGNHISEMDVLNNDGRRYIYGIPVYNLKQKDATFSVNKADGDVTEGLVSYVDGVDNTVNNIKGRDNYFNSEEIPAYAHSFLLTSILSPDYVDLTGDGISDDDLGDAIKFKYTKVCGVENPFGWRAPYTNQAAYEEGMKTDSRDDRGNYSYGEKELWYMNSIESKNMIATFTVENRMDSWAINEAGNKIAISSAKKLKQIDLYTKADFQKRGVNARPIKTVHFEYDYELCTGINHPLTNDTIGKLTLKRIWFTYNGNDKGKLNPYEFTYHANNPHYNIKSYDKWGNYKDPLQNPGSTTSDIINNAEYPYPLQDTALANYNAGAWTLTQIKLPSGGSMKVNYESDDYAYVQNKRASQMFKLAGFSAHNDGTDISNSFFNAPLFNDNLYVYVNVTTPVTSRQDVYNKYLDGISKLYFKLSMPMPTDKWGNGNEYVPVYADIEDYGTVSGHTNQIWIKLKGINLAGDGDGQYSPLAKAAIQFLRLNLPSKAFPGSETGDNITVKDAVNILLSMVTNILDLFLSFDDIARVQGWGKFDDLNRTLIRLDNPNYKKIGGGLRVKNILIYDNWNAMTGQKESVYGQQYDYTTVADINGVPTRISSGVASYEPTIGGDENPFHAPIEYDEKIAPLAPVTMGYTEEPLGESFFPSASVGYSKVRVKSIHTANRRSANGYEETQFFTTYDFPTITDRSMLDNDTKKRFKPAIANFLKINAQYYLTMSQGFKVELNDMNGKMKSQATYPQTDSVNYISYTENFYKVEDKNATVKKLANNVTVIDPHGNVDTTALIGKDVELMADMREQLSVSNGNNFQINGDFFTMPFPPIFMLPSLLGLAQREENRFRSAATLKVIQRYGILDSVVHIDKGSRVSTENLAYDSETGDVLLTRTRNEFNDSIYNFNYPAHWAYDGMGMAYQNIDLVFDHVYMKNGKITSTLTGGADTTFFASGDEILVASKPKTGAGKDACNDAFATFPSFSKIWAIDTSAVHGGAKAFYFIDADGNAFSGNDISLKVIRSGRKNMGGSVGAVTTMANPLVYDATAHNYKLQLNTNSKVLNASAAAFNQLWKAADKKKSGRVISCGPDSSFMPRSGDNQFPTCNCLKNLFDYLIYAHRLFIQPTDNVVIDSLVRDAFNAGYAVHMNDCPILQKNAGKLFYAITTDAYAPYYRAQIGNCTIRLQSTINQPINFYALQSKACGDESSTISYNYLQDTLQKTIFPTTSLVFRGYTFDAFQTFYDTTYNDDDDLDSSSDRLEMSHFPFLNTDPRHWVSQSSFRFDSLPPLLGSINVDKVLTARMKLYAYPEGFWSVFGPGGLLGTQPTPYASYPLTASYAGSNYSTGGSRDGGGYELYCNNTPWHYGMRPEAFLASQRYPDGTCFRMNPMDTVAIGSYFQDFNIDIKSALPGWKAKLYDASCPFNGGFSLSLFDSIDNSQSDHPLADWETRTVYLTFCSQHYHDPTYWPRIDITYTDTTYRTVAQLFAEECITCDTINTSFCYSALTDTIVNPYSYGILGNYRAQRSYVYYGPRQETDPRTATNIRTNGTFGSFTPFWQFSGGQLMAQPDTTRWTWNSEMTLFNTKGFEIENKDPLGRYNAGLYGYNNTLPTAVIQNSQYRETAFEGFEDYGFIANACGALCASPQHFDLSAYAGNIDSTQQHTGKYSVHIAAGDSLSFAYQTDTLSAIIPALKYRTDTACGSSYLKSLHTDSSSLLPAFKPLAGKKAVFSAWVKENTDCKCEKYTSNSVLVVITAPVSGNKAYHFTPSGNIIEGWQRYESIIDVPADATAVSVEIKATGSTDIYVDDIRILPFNANMKSFVYNPVNLRLMAELDENNYATFYEYDDDGTLIRVKKETERGIMTIKETRSALLKQ